MRINHSDKFLFSLLLVGLCFGGCLAKDNEEIWTHDMSNSFKIAPTTDGLQRVNLRCGAETMLIELETEQEFSGVVYTRGSFYKQKGPCFVKPETGRTARKLSMKFRLDQCQTVEDNGVYSNVVIVQHEPDLVMPGDAAFAVECDYRNPRSITMNADMQTRDRVSFLAYIQSTAPHKQSPRDWTTSEVSFVPKNMTHGQKQVTQKRGDGSVASLRLEDEL